MIIFLGLLGAGLLPTWSKPSPRWSAMWMSMAKQIARMLQTPSFWRQRG